jgi:hypothetical protein
MSKWIELVLYEGEERMIDFGQLNEALVIFTIQLQEELDELFISKSSRVNISKSNGWVHAAWKPKDTAGN